MNKQKVFENLQYVSLGLGIMAQVTLGKAYFLGQILYLCAYGISAFRTIVLYRPKADKVMEFTNLALTLGLILLGFFIF